MAVKYRTTPQVFGQVPRHRVFLAFTTGRQGIPHHSGVLSIRYDNEVTGGKQYTAKGTDTRQENTDTIPSAATLENPSPEITPEEIGEILAEEEESNEYPQVPPIFHKETKR